MSPPRILVAGVGNIFLADDAFGVAVVERLAHCRLPPSVRLVDFGIRGLDLVYALLDGYEIVILVDAMPRGGSPGDLYLVEPDASEWQGADGQGAAMIETHRLDPAQVLKLAGALGARVERLLAVGCEPTPLDEYEDIQPGLTAPVQAAVAGAVQMILRLIDELLGGQGEIEPNTCNVQAPSRNDPGAVTGASS